MRSELDKFMEEKIDELNAMPKIKQAIKYSLLNNGKRFRPLIFLSFLSDNQNYYDIAMAIECIHAYSLVHDDLPAIDNDKYRRGDKSCWYAYDQATALLVGDSLLTLAFDLVANCSVEEDKKVKLISILSKKAGVNQGMINGQMLDIFAENKDFDLLTQIAYEKTGALLTASLLMGNVINQIESDSFIEELGLNLGLFYQMHDDYLDYYGDFETLGKEVQSDMRNQKITFASLMNQKEFQNQLMQLQEKLKFALETSNLTNNTKQLLLKIINVEIN